MPELPEVETTIRALRKKVLNRTFIDFYTDSSKQIKKPKLAKFKKELIGKKIKKIERRAKNILFWLSENKTLLIHQKMTGHLLVGKWKMRKGKWFVQNKGALEEKVNQYLHFLFFLDNKQTMALSDLRKFAKIELWDNKELAQSKQIKELGPEPLEKSFTFAKFKQRLKNKKGKIKQVLMDQKVIAGIGNIYSDEILFEAKVDPFKNTSKLKEKELKKIYSAVKKILKKAVKLKGTSISDYRDPQGEPGFFEKHRKVYRRTGEKCKICGTIIKRVKIGGRSAHFCPQCQAR